MSDVLLKADAVSFPQYIGNLCLNHLILLKPLELDYKVPVYLKSICVFD